jgi:hypothetical protein
MIRKFCSIAGIVVVATVQSCNPVSAYDKGDKITVAVTTGKYVENCRILDDYTGFYLNTAPCTLLVPKNAKLRAVYQSSASNYCLNCSTCETCVTTNKIGNAVQILTANSSELLVGY